MFINLIAPFSYWCACSLSNLSGFIVYVAIHLLDSKNQVLLNVLVIHTVIYTIVFPLPHEGYVHSFHLYCVICSKDISFKSISS